FRLYIEVLGLVTVEIPKWRRKSVNRRLSPMTTIYLLTVFFFQQPSTSAGIIEEKEAGETEAEQEDMSDSDDDISYEEYCNRKDILLNKIILSERMWNKMMVTYRYTRLKEASLQFYLPTEQEKEAIANRTDAEYLRREAALEAQAKEEQDKERTIYDLESAALERDHEGEMDLIERGYRDRRQYIFSQLIYERQLIANKLLARIIREDEVRADARIFVGNEIPDEWLDEFVAEYVDALEAEENSEEAVKERNRRRYRKEAGESLDDGRPLSNLLDKAYANGKWGQRCSIRPLPQVYYDELEHNKIDRQRKEERQKIIDMKVENMNNKTFERFFPYKKKPSRPRVSVLSDSVRISSEDVEEMFEESKYEEDLEKMEKFKKKMDKVKKMKKETIVKRMRARKREREILKTTTTEPEVITIKEPEVITLEDTEESVKNKHSRTKKNSVVKNRITKPKPVPVLKNLKRQRTKKEIEELEYCRGFIMDCNDEIKNLDKRTAEIMMKETKRFELEEMMEMKKRMRKEVDESPESGSITDGTSTPKSETLESETGIIDPGVNDTTIVDTGIRDTGLVDNAQQSDEYASESEEEEEEVDLETTLREGIRAILTTFGKPIPNDERNDKRVDRLRESLTNVLNERRQLREDPELARVQQKMISSLGEMTMESDNSDVSDFEEHSMQDFTLEQQVREASFVRGLVERSIKRPNMGPWLDIYGRAEGAVERVRHRKEQLQEKLASMKRERLRKRMMGSDSYEEQEIRYWEMKEEERRKKMEEVDVKGESDEEFSDEEGEEEEEVGAYEENGKIVEEEKLTEEEKTAIEEKERKLRQIRAVIEGRDPNDIDEPIPIMIEEVKEEVKEEMEEKEDEEVPVKQIVYSKKQGKNARLTYLRNLTGANGWLKKRRSSSSEEEDEEVEEYDSKQRISFGEIPTYRLAEQPKVRFKPQLSQERIMQDLIRSGALRERETYGEHIEKLDNERRQVFLIFHYQRILETLPSTSSADLTKLLSPRSRVALEDFPSEAFARLSKEERNAFIEDLPSPSKDSDDSDEDEYGKKRWDEEEEEKEEVKRENGDGNHREMMEVDDDRIEEDEQRMEEPRGKEIVEFSPPSAVGASPLHPEESSIQKKKSIPRINGFSRTGSTAAF
ncbi:hypothetical protein PRIPAC_76704, partial [Pristionchus pacificus]|uniref:Uncharacterized protein n=1 Tax=Pristionchus pacificus TaxID=54126 RepID=A0A2A6C9X5_PRIPA